MKWFERETIWFEDEIEFYLWDVDNERHLDISGLIDGDVDFFVI